MAGAGPIGSDRARELILIAHDITIRRRRRRQPLDSSQERRSSPTGGSFPAAARNLDRFKLMANALLSLLLSQPELRVI